MYCYLCIVVQCRATLKLIVMQTFDIIYKLICLIVGLWLVIGIFNKNSNFNK